MSKREKILKKIGLLILSALTMANLYYSIKSGAIINVVGFLSSLSVAIWYLSDLIRDHRDKKIKSFNGSITGKIVNCKIRTNGYNNRCSN